MSLVNASHTKAMDLAEAAALAQIKGDHGRFRELSKEALEFEIRAICELESEEEPLFSLLHRSAATLALDCGNLRDAERLSATALSRELPTQVADDFRGILEKANFRRHLQVRGVDLGKDEVQISLSGPGVGVGLIEQAEYHSRITSLAALLFRTAERLADRVFRERGPVPKAIKRRYPVFVSAPRAGSVAATLRVGSPVGEQYLDGMLNTRAVIDDVVDVLEILNDKQDGQLEVRIPDTAYRQNFVALAKQIAPDEDKIHQVGLTTVSTRRTRTVSITRPRTEIPAVSSAPAGKTSEATTFSVVGTLRFADATRSGANAIKLIETHGTSHNISVPAGLMNDVVRPHWDQVVRVAGVERSGKKELTDIAPMDPE